MISMKRGLVKLIFSVGLMFLSLNLSAQGGNVQFDTPRQGIAKGKIDTIQYQSKTVGTTRKALIYTPPGFSTAKKYPVLYLLHGIGGDEKEWLRGGQPHVILDNLYADKKIEDMMWSCQTGGR